jgi:ribosome-binding factor A
VRPSGADKEQEASLAGLQAAAPYIRHELGKRLKVRQIPEIRFEADRALEHAMHIEKLLSEIDKDD